MFQAKISKEEINALPIERFDGEIIVIETISDVYKVVKYLENQTTLGFDTETRPSFKKGRKNKVALLQLSTNEMAFIIRLNKTGLPPVLAEILANPAITKVGAAIRDDIKALQKLTHFHPQGFVELQNYVQQFNIESFGLKKLAAIVLNIKISKRQQLSNWEREELTDAQCIYAATDAWVALKIYRKLQMS